MVYNVEISRAGYASATFTVDAVSEQDAELKALQKAYDYEFSEQVAEYEVMNVQEK